MSASFHLISGCSGSGKSTLLGELGRRGHATAPEPGRLVVQDQLAAGGTALPWDDAVAFMHLVLKLAVEQFERADPGRSTFFDRGIVDAACGMRLMDWPMPAGLERVVETHRYAKRVFMTPPWEEIYETDGERRHAFAEGVADYEAKLPEYLALGYDVVEVPAAPVVKRADFVLAHI